MVAISTWKLSLQLMLLQLLIVNYNEANYLCQNLQLQNCSRIECTPAGFSFECPRMSSLNNHWQALMKISVNTNNGATLQCTSHDVNYEWLNGISIGYVNFLDIQSCPMPKMSLSTFLANMNITGMKKIRIDHGLGNLTIDDQYFHKIDNITHLLLPSNFLTELPSQLFQNMRDLTNLDLHGNNITLQNGELAGLISLKKLDIGENNIHQLLPGTFKDLKKLEFLTLWGNKISNLTKDMFIGLENISSLDFTANEIVYISPDTFMEMENLKILSLVKNNLTSLPEKIFSATKKLELVKLQNNHKLSQIPRRLFADLPQLNEIILSRCNLSTVPEDMFWNTSKLAKVDISRNSLVTLPELLFRDTEYLKELDISNNKIASIHGSPFASLKNLQILHLEKNKLTSINEELLQGPHELQSLYLNNNNIEDIHHYAFQTMTKLQILVMSHNNITFNNFIRYDSSPISNCPNLQELDLSHNNIRTMFSDWMWILRKLHSLNLSYNNFTYISAQDLQFLSPRILVNLQYNKIATLNLSFLELMNSQTAIEEASTDMLVVDLTGNELECNCKIYDVLRYQEKRMKPITYNRLRMIINTLSCRGPPPLAGYPISKLNSLTFKCEWQHSNKCPTQCQCFHWIAAKHLEVNCTGASLTQIPQELLNPTFPDKLLMDLYLDNNSLHSLSLNTSLNKTNVTTLSVSHNYISWIEDGALPKNLKELKLDHNNMTRMNSSLLEFLTNRTNVSLHSNPWNCDCKALDLLGFLQNSFRQVKNLYNITCKEGNPIALLIAEEICPVDQTIIIVASSITALLGILGGLLAALYFRYQNEVKVWLYAHNMCLWFVTEEELDKDKIYDAFISYSHQDEDFVATKLLPELENGTPPYKICIHYRDWIVGEFITTQITRSVDESKRTVVILSKNFIKSEWGRLEFRAAHKQALSEKRARVIVVVYGDLGPIDELDSELRSYLSTNTYVKWGDPWFWDKLRYALPHQRRPALKKSRGPDKLELINSSAIIKSSTPPAEVAINPLEVINNLSNKRCKILNELNGFTNNGFANGACEISVKSSDCE
uniref:Toll-like receptor n=1 Tax=Gryllus bimaculatus TaxID=6999 RepID=A0A455RC95_GRYBI|nr:Toll-like receptor [Gryllus bimaculatus]